MNFFKIYRKLTKSYNDSLKKDFDSENYFYSIYRTISFPVTVLAIWLGFSANFVTFLSLSSMLFSFYLIVKGMLLYGGLIYFLAYILDFADGNIARYHKKSNYFGKFIDGLVDSVTFLLFVSVGYYFFKIDQTNYYNKLIFFISIITSFSFQFYSYFFCRLSLMRFEINSINNDKNNSTNIKNNYDEKNNSILEIIKKVIRLVFAFTSTTKLATPIIFLLFCIVDKPDYFIILFVFIHAILGFFEILIEIVKNFKYLNISRKF